MLILLVSFFIMFRNKELFARKVMRMHQRDIERFAFLYLCGKRDRDILLGKEKMTFSDFDRLNYLTDFLGLKVYNLEIWNEYAGQFGEQFQRLERLYNEDISATPGALEETDEHPYDRWIQEFCRQVPERKSRKWLEQFLEQKYKEKGMAVPGETDIV